MKTNEIDHIIIEVWDKRGDKESFNGKSKDGSIYMEAVRWLERIID